MAFTILHQPSDLSFVKKQMAYKVNTDSYILTAGQSNVITIDTLVFRPTNGQNVTFTFAGIVTVFNFTNVVTNEPTSLPAFAAYSNNIWVNILFQNFLGNKTLTDHYIITQSGTNIILTSREPKNLVSSVAPATGVTIVAGINRVVRSDLKVFCKVVVDNQEVEMSLPPDNAGNAVFYLQNILSAFLYKNNNTFTLPAINATAGILHSDLIKKFYVLTADYYDERLFKYTTAGLCFKDYLFTNGGTSKKINQNNVEIFDSPSFAHTGAFVLLTNEPKKNKMLSHFQPEWLTFYAKATGTHISVKLWCKNDLTGITDTYFISSVVPHIAKTKFSIPVGVQNIFPPAALAQLHNYSQFKIDIATGVADTPLSVFYSNTYRLECHHKKMNYFIFENAVGGLDTLKLVGECEPTVKLDRQEAGRILPYNYNPEHGDSFQFDIQAEETFKITSEYFQEEEYMAYLREIDMATFMQHIVFANPNNPSIANAKYVPVGSNASTIDPGSNRDSSWRFKFAFSYLFIENSL